MKTKQQVVLKIQEIARRMEGRHAKLAAWPSAEGEGHLDRVNKLLTEADEDRGKKEALFWVLHMKDEI